MAVNTFCLCCQVGCGAVCKEYIPGSTLCWLVTSLASVKCLLDCWNLLTSVSISAQLTFRITAMVTNTTTTIQKVTQGTHEHTA